MSARDSRAPWIYAKKVHMAGKIDASGHVSALCYKRPHAIDLRTQNWSLTTDTVTCSRCKKALAAARVLQETLVPDGAA